MTHPEVTVPIHRARRGRHHPLVLPPVERVSRRCRRTPATAAQWRLPRFGIRAVGRSRAGRPQAGARRQFARPAPAGRRPQAVRATGARRRGFASGHSRPAARNLQPATSGPQPPARDIRPASSGPRWKCRTFSDTRDGNVTPASLVTDIPAFRTTGIRAAPDSRDTRCPPHPTLAASNAHTIQCLTLATSAPARNAGHLVTRGTDASHLPHW